LSSSRDDGNFSILGAHAILNLFQTTIKLFIEVRVYHNNAGIRFYSILFPTSGGYIQSEISLFLIKMKRHSPLLQPLFGEKRTRYFSLLSLSYK